MDEKVPAETLIIQLTEACVVLMTFLVGPEALGKKSPDISPLTTENGRIWRRLHLPEPFHIENGQFEGLSNAQCAFSDHKAVDHRESLFVGCSKPTNRPTPRTDP